MYGQTGSGKTFTMMGNNEGPSINFNALKSKLSLQVPHLQNSNNTKRDVSPNKKIIQIHDHDI